MENLSFWSNYALLLVQFSCLYLKGTVGACSETFAMLKCAKTHWSTAYTFANNKERQEHMQSGSSSTFDLTCSSPFTSQNTGANLQLPSYEPQMAHITAGQQEYVSTHTLWWTKAKTGNLNWNPPKGWTDHSSMIFPAEVVCDLFCQDDIVYKF